MSLILSKDHPKYRVYKRIYTHYWGFLEPKRKLSRVETRRFKSIFRKMRRFIRNNTCLVDMLNFNKGE